MQDMCPAIEKSASHTTSFLLEFYSLFSPMLEKLASLAILFLVTFFSLAIAKAKERERSALARRRCSWALTRVPNWSKAQTHAFLKEIEQSQPSYRNPFTESLAVHTAQPTIKFDSPPVKFVPSPKLPPDTEAVEGQPACVICIMNTKTHCVVPCGHKVTCNKCSTLSLKSCPVCRGIVDQIVRVFE